MTVTKKTNIFYYSFIYKYKLIINNLKIFGIKQKKPIGIPLGLNFVKTSIKLNFYK